MMAVKNTPYYWLECDACGEKADYGDYSAWREESHAVDCALDADWTTDGERYHCPDCHSLFEDDATEAGDR